MKKIGFLWMVFLLVGCNGNEVEDVEENLVGISENEIADLQFLKEEEKLARDIYLLAYDVYGQNIFKNISNSEQIHMNSVTVILEKYQIEDLSFSDRGNFSNIVLQNLYNDLASLVAKSKEDALIVGATIEDLDINDIDEFMVRTDHEDISDMYHKLNCGSRNHLRAYTANLENLNLIYDPQFISVEEFNHILSEDWEICNN